MANERQTDLILRAQVDQALQPLSQVTQRLKDFITVLDQQRAAVKTGDTTLGEYAKSLRDVERASGDLLKQRAALENFATRGQRVDTQSGIVAERQQRRDTLAASLSDTPTNTEIAALARLDKALASSQTRLETVTIAYQRATDQLQRLGVLTEALAANQQRLRLDQANATISDSVLQATQALAAGHAVDDTLVATLKLANVSKQVAAQRERDTARFIADQERERQATLDAAEAIRAKGRASQEAVDAQSSRNIRRFDIEETFRAQEAEQRLAAQRETDAARFQAQQARLAAAVTFVWAEEDAAAEKVRAQFAAFGQAVERVVAQAQAARASAAAGAGALGQPVALPATTLAAQVRTALAGGPGAGVGVGDLGGLQSEIGRISASVITGRADVSSYTQELKNLDAVSREVVRQSQIVDSFQKQQKAAREALLAVRDAATELRRLEDAAKSASTPEQLSEVTSAIAAQRRKIGSVDDGTGLLGNARAQQEALALEQAALTKIGIGADEVSDAMRRLTAVAVETSTTRQAIINRERAAFDATADDIIRRAAGLSTAASTSTPSARSAVQAVAGAGRTSDIEDVTAATDKLDKSVTKATLTAQSFNRTMDEVFAVQRQIASDATLIDQFTAQKAAVDKATAAYTAAQAELARVGAAAKAGTADLAELRRAEASLTGAANDLQRQATLQNQLDTALKARRIDTANLTVETDKLVQASQRLAAVQARTQQGGGTLFGLSSYQVQNLGFQVNDVITQLSLGQGVLRTFESQAGQIFQIFETSVTAMRRMVLYGAPAAAVIGIIVLALLRLKDTADAQREFSRLLTASADGLAYQAKQLTATARVIESFGVSFDDARLAVRTFMRDGLSIETMLQFARTAQNLTHVTGIDFPDALKAVGVIARGSYADIVKLNDEYGFLHASELQTIKDAFDFGRASEGRTIAINAATRAFQAGREQGVDPLKQGMENLTTAWKEFLDAIGSTQLLTALVLALTNITKLASETALAIRYILNPTQAEANSKVNLLQTALKNTQEQIEKITKSGLPGDEPLALLEGRAKDLTRQLEEAIKVRDKMLAGGVPGLPGAPGGTATLPSQFASLPGPDSRVSRTIPPDMLAVIAGAAAAAGIKEADLQALYRNEAARNPDGSFGTSSAGAVGAFQLLPDTFKEVVAKFQGLFDQLSKMIGKPIDIKTNEFNALAGALYFKEQASTFGSSALGAAAYNMGPGSTERGTGLRGVLGGQKLLPSETAQYVANFMSPQGATATGLPGFQRNPNATNTSAIQQQQAADALEKELAGTVDETLRGNERILSDQKRLIEFYKQKSEEIESKFPGALDTPGPARTAFNALIDKFAETLENARRRQIEAADNAVLQIVKSAQVEADKANKTSREAQIRAVDEQFAGRLSALNEQIAHGASGMVTDQAMIARDALLKLREQARRDAVVAADRAVVDSTVKARDLQVQSVENDLKSGAITLEAAFERIATIVKAFNPQIQAALGRSNADLRGQPQTPAVQEQLAKNQAVDATGQRAVAGVDKTAMDLILSKEKERNDLVASYNQLVKVGALTQNEADKKITEAYNKTTPQIKASSAALQNQLNIQKEQGVISEETYDRMSAGLKKVAADTNHLTKLEQLLSDGIANSVANNAVQAFNTVADAIGAAVAKTASWSDVLTSIGTAFAQFTAGILRDVAAIIIKYEVLALIKSVLGIGPEGGLGSNYHTGGVVGAPTQSRSGLSASTWIGAPRAHGGGMAGLAYGEVPVIVQAGEEILTADNPRHRNNYNPGAGAEQSPSSIRNVILFDPSEVAASMAGAPGEKVTLAHIRRNAPALRQILGVGNK